MFWTVLFLVIQLMILGTLWGILMGMKNGFNQVIAGLEALDRSAARMATEDDARG